MNFPVDFPCEIHNATTGGPATMSTNLETSPATETPKALQPQRRPVLFWAAPLLSIAAIATFFMQVFGAGVMITPWYLPVAGTVAAIVALWMIGRPLRWWRVVVAIGCLLLACLQWAFLLRLSVLPAYAGPIAGGSALPSFHANLADGTEITESDFQQGETSALIFFQGRWCPFCMTHLRELEAHHGQLDRVGARVVVVSIEDVETAAQTQRDFPNLVVLSDRRRELADAVDVINRGFGPEGQDSAAPTILLIDGAGKVLSIHRPTRFIARPSAAELAAEVVRLRKI